MDNNIYVVTRAMVQHQQQYDDIRLCLYVVHEGIHVYICSPTCTIKFQSHLYFSSYVCAGDFVEKISIILRHVPSSYIPTIYIYVCGIYLPYTIHE